MPESIKKNAVCSSVPAKSRGSRWQSVAKRGAEGGRARCVNQTLFNLPDILPPFFSGTEHFLSYLILFYSLKNQSLTTSSPSKFRFISKENSEHFPEQIPPPVSPKTLFLLDFFPARRKPARNRFRNRIAPGLDRPKLDRPPQSSAGLIPRLIHINFREGGCVHK